MKQNEREGEKFPPCGYGLLGLCCSACLLGPCRLSPFDSGLTGGLCGDDRDLIVAKNLLRLAAREAVHEINNLKKIVHDAAPPSGKGPGKAEKKILTERYGLPPNLSMNRLINRLFKECRNLLSFFPENRSSLFSVLYPERAFPQAGHGSFSFSSLTSLLLDSMDGQNGSLKAEEVLKQCLRISMLTLFSEELRRDINHLTGGEPLTEKDQQAFDALKDLPPDPVPVLVILAGEENDRGVRECEDAFRDDAFTLSIQGIASLPEIGRRLSRRWFLPVTEMEAIALVSSSSITWVLGALALGFAVVSLPALPIHGSERVEKFFKKYSPSRDTLLEFLREKMKYLLIGSGPAGIFAAEAIRERDAESPVMMITADDGLAYSPVMSTYYLAGNLPRERLHFRDPSWAGRKRIDFQPGQRVTSLQTALRKVVLAEGREIPYDRLLIATGSTPISLPIPGIRSKGVTSLRGLHDAEEILGGCSGADRVVVIGGGFIGLKLACHLKERGLSVTVLEKEPKLAARMFDLKASRLVEKKLRIKEITVETDVEVVEVLNGKGWVSGILLKDGRTFPCERIIEAVGVRPNSQFLIDSGIHLKGGILVNGRMETNVPGVYAAGDVAMTIDPISSDWMNNATWPAATRQGRVAGSNMAGGDLTYIHNFTLNALNLFGFQVMAGGHAYYEKGSDVDVLLEERKESYRKVVIRRGQVIGFILIGDISGAGYLLSLMKRKETLSFDLANRLVSPDAPVHPLPPNLGYNHGSIFQRKGEQS